VGTTGRDGLCALRGIGATQHSPGGGELTCRGAIGGPKVRDRRPRRCGLTGDPALVLPTLRLLVLDEAAQARMQEIAAAARRDGLRATARRLGLSKDRVLRITRTVAA